MFRFPGQVSMRFALASLLAVAAVTGCKSKQDAAIEQAKKQAAATGQAQQVVYTDSNGNTVTSVVQPPQPGQTGQTITTTVTPKPTGATLPAQQAADATAPSATNPTGAVPAPATTDAAGQPVPQQTASTTAQPAPMPAAATESSPVVRPVEPPKRLAAGTSLSVRIDQSISAKSIPDGTRFTGEVIEPVTDANGNTVIPKLARVSGEVDGTKGRGHFKGAATIELRLTSINLRGREYPLETSDTTRTQKGKGKRTAAFIGGGSGLGALIGGLAGGGRGALIGGLAGAGAGTAGAGLTGNRDLVIPAESVVRFRLADELVIRQ